MKINKKKPIITTFFCLLFFIIAFCIAFMLQKKNEKDYKLANSYLSDGQYFDAQKVFYDLGKYKNSENLLDETNKCIEKKEIYDKALEEYRFGDYDSAIMKLNTILDFGDSKDQLNIITYDLALSYFNNNELNEARKYFLLIEDYEDSADYLSRIDIRMADDIARTAYNQAMLYYNQESYQEALNIFEDLGNYDDSKEKAVLCKENIKRLDLAHTIAAGIRYSLLLTEDGKVRTAGSNSDGQCNVDTWEDIISVDGYGVCTIGLKKDGTVEVAGNLTTTQKARISSWKNIVDVAAGERYVVALQNDGRVVADGHNGDYQCDVGNWKNIIDIDAGWRFTVGLTDNGELLYAGQAKKQISDYESDTEAWKDVIKISASGGQPNGHLRGGGHTVGLKSDGTLVAVGDNNYGQCDFDKNIWKDIVDVAAGDWYTVGLTKEGKVLITGQNKPGVQYIDVEKLNSWINIKDIAAGYGQTLALGSDGYVYGMGFDDDNKLSDISN